MTSSGELWRRDMQANSHSTKGRALLTLFRFGNALPRLARMIYQPLYYLLTDVLMGVTLPLGTSIGGGFMIRHGQGTVISKLSSWGSGCIVHQNVTVGQKNWLAPQIGDDVILGAGAILLGGITIGDGARVAAGAVVISDVPPGAVARGPVATVTHMPGGETA